MDWSRRARVAPRSRPPGHEGGSSVPTVTTDHREVSFAAMAFAACAGYLIQGWGDIGLQTPLCIALAGSGRRRRDRRRDRVHGERRPNRVIARERGRVDVAVHVSRANGWRWASRGCCLAACSAGDDGGQASLDTQSTVPDGGQVSLDTQSTVPTEPRRWRSTMVCSPRDGSTTGGRPVPTSGPIQVDFGEYGGLILANNALTGSYSSVSFEVTLPDGLDDEFLLLRLASDDVSYPDHAVELTATANDGVMTADVAVAIYSGAAVSSIASSSRPPTNSSWGPRSASTTCS